MSVHNDNKQTLLSDTADSIVFRLQNKFHCFLHGSVNLMHFALVHSTSIAAV